MVSNLRLSVFHHSACIHTVRIAIFTGNSFYTPVTATHRWFMVTLVLSLGTAFIVKFRERQRLRWNAENVIIGAHTENVLIWSSRNKCDFRRRWPNVRVYWPAIRRARGVYAMRKCGCYDAVCARSMHSSVSNSTLGTCVRCVCAYASHSTMNISHEHWVQSTMAMCTSVRECIDLTDGCGKNVIA